ncbi:MAG: ABC transporter ATP-binding protein [Alphaproteobacteria bacterium]
MAGLQIEGLCKGWDFPVIDQLDLEVEEGEFFVIVGPSGAGKTTLLRLIAGLESPDAGVVRVAGRDLTNKPPYDRNVAMTFESYALYPHLTVFENIASPLHARRLGKAQIAEQVGKVAELLRITPLLTRKPGEISGGQKQRTALGRTLVASPDVFLLDEPLSHLDAKIRHALRRQFHTLKELRQVATVYVTHDYSEALSLGDRIGVMDAGMLTQIGTARDLFERPNSVFVAQQLGQPGINLLACTLGDEANTIVVQGTGVTFPVAPKHRTHLAKLPNKIVTVGIRPQHLDVVDPAKAADKSVLDARVILFEALGATGVLQVDVDGTDLTSLTTPNSTLDHGQPVGLKVRSQDFLYFHPDTGANLLDE